MLTYVIEWFFFYHVLLGILSSYSVHHHGLPSLDVDDYEVVVPDTACPISASRVVELRLVYDLSSPCDDFVMSLYHNTL